MSLVHKKGYGIDNKDAYSPHRADSYVAPSWSWASQTYPVDYSQVSGEYANAAAAPPAFLSDEVARVTGAQLARAGTEPMDMQKIHSGELKLRGKLRKIIACPGPGWPDTKHKPFELREASGELLAPVVFDDPNEIGNDELWLECLWCYPRELKFKDQGRWHGFGLALLKIEEKEKAYRRVGYFDLVPLDYCKDSERAEISII